MIQLQILSGKQAGTQWVARRFPVRVGRAAGCELQLEEPGVWDEHVEIQLDAGGFQLVARPEALLVLNGQPIQRAVLANGDLLELGALKLKFWLGPARQRSLLAAEVFFWALLAAVCMGQLALVFWLPH